MKIYVSHHEIDGGGIQLRGRHPAELIAPIEVTTENGRSIEGPPEEIWVRVGTEIMAIAIKDLAEYLDQVKSRRSMFATRKSEGGRKSGPRTLH